MTEGTNLRAPASRLARSLAAAAALALSAGLARSAPGGEWPAYGGDAASSRYSALRQIDTANVRRLRVAWTYHTGDHRADNRSQIQTNPIVVGGVLYGVSPALKAFALRAGTGEELWKFDPYVGRRAEDHVSRGVVYWTDGSERRILYSAGSRLFALDAATGRPVPGFGRGGYVDLREGLGRDTAGLYVIGTTPGVLYRDLLIQGTRVSEGEGAAPGHVRAFDVRTGRVRWTFHTIPRPGEPGSETWTPEGLRGAGGANSWAGISLDAERGIVFVPTGSATPDFYGGDRPGENLYANTLLALRAATGERVWHFQTVRHDIWDRDLPAPPNLVTVTHGGRRVDAVAQITKSGWVFLLDRLTGAPLFPVEERPVPPSDLRGEQAWPTQPFPTRPAPFARQSLTEDDLTDLSPEARDSVLRRFRTLRSAGQYVPPSVQGSIVFPGFDGGGEWGGAAVDPRSAVMYVNASEMAWIAAMTERERTTGVRSGEAVYAAVCASCHGPDLAGRDRSPSLRGVGERLSAAEIRRVIERGKGFMPAFASLPEAEKAGVTAYLLGQKEPGATRAPAAGRPQGAENRPSWRFAGYERFLDPNGYPAVKPPWGTLNAIDLNTGEIAWKVPLGEYPELTARGIPRTGTENYGGPIVTAGGLVFIGATRDERIRAFDARTGRLLWEAQLPAGGYATPATYEVDGKQYVVIAAGGGKMGTKSGDAYVAFALP